MADQPQTTQTKRPEQTSSQAAISKLPVFLAGAGLGLVAAYMLDPEHGPTRRAKLASQGAKASRTGAKAIDGRWRDLIHRFTGFIHEIIRRVHLSESTPKSPVPPAAKAKLDQPKTDDRVSH